MSVCPSCSQQITITDKHMGALFNCPHCRAVFFVGLDGQPEAPPEHEPLPVEPLPQEVAEGHDVAEIAIEGPPVEFPAELSTERPSEPPTDVPAWAIPQENVEATEQDFAVSSEQPTGGDLVQEEALVGEPPSATEFEAPTEVETPSQTPVQENPSSGRGLFDDVTDFANSETPVGALSYTLTIGGLELAETFELLKESVTDSRFGWDAEALMSQVRDGRLVIRGMSAAKASILVQRIKSFSLEISWTQDLYASTSAESSAGSEGDVAT